mmetsp:Transcript_22363/g.36082  ORF Transcript_22363/g.36082 Transcript_22363/m.36082 type:complete len:375 (+) Transcript_22363:362-1486(+)
MDSMRTDLHDASNAADPEAVDKRFAGSFMKQGMCSKCRSLDSPGGKVRYCGRCRTTAYCSKECAKADWAEHKHQCESIRTTLDEDIASYVADGGQKKDFFKTRGDIKSWSNEVPGLRNELDLLAWKHRGEAVIIRVSGHETDIDGSGLRIEVVPRSSWDTDPPDLVEFSDVFLKSLRQRHSATSFDPNKEFALVKKMMHPVHSGSNNVIPMRAFVIRRFDHLAIRGVKIVEALVAGTGAEELTDAFAYLKGSILSSHPPDHVAQILQAFVTRSAYLCGRTTPHNSAPIPGRAFHNEIAYMILHQLDLEVDVRLTGLRNAAHLNGREGALRCSDPANSDRFKVVLDDGTCVSVLASNFVHIRRGNYRRRSPERSP